MTRKSKREIERALEDLGGDDSAVEWSDARLGVTADFVTYEHDGADDPGDARPEFVVVGEGSE